MFDYLKSKSYLEEVIKAVVEIAEEASKKILQVYTGNKIEAKMKEDNSPLTLADRESHAHIVHRLTKSFPYPILSEEGNSYPYSERKLWSKYWLIDPLDGTKEFIKRNGEFTVNIALIQHGEPVLGVVSVPVKDETYFAFKDGGAYFKKDGNVVLLQKRESVDLSQTGLRVVASKSHMNDETALFIRSLPDPQLMSLGSSLKFIAVAKGEADIYPRYIPSMEWDTAASDIIVREVGLSILQVSNGRPLSYNKENLLNPFFICK